MRRKLTVGLILFVVGIFLDIVSDLMGMWIIQIPAIVLKPVGMVMGIDALLVIHQQKQSKDSSRQETEKENN